MRVKVYYWHSFVLFSVFLLLSTFITACSCDDEDETDDDDLIGRNDAGQDDDDTTDDDDDDTTDDDDDNDSSDDDDDNDDSSDDDDDFSNYDDDDDNDNDDSSAFCTVGEVRCNGNILQACNPGLGGWVVSADCSSMAKECVNGACVAAEDGDEDSDPSADGSGSGGCHQMPVNALWPLLGLLGLARRRFFR